jgi:DNA polymerase-3 subunit epsilon
MPGRWPVYIQMTRGQEVLVIDAAETASQAIEVEGIDFGKFELIVLQATEEELAAHEGVLAELDKSSKGRTVWRGLVA